MSEGPGLATDTMARLLSDRLSKNLNQQFVVENIAGAAGILDAQTDSQIECDTKCDTKSLVKVVPLG